MSPDDSDEPFRPAAVRKRLVGVLAEGSVSFSGHALDEMQNDGITQDEALSIMRGGVVEPGEFERGCWRYRIRAAKVFVVVTFRSPERVVVVTAWRAR